MGTVISRQRENRIQKKMREAGQMKRAVEGFKLAASKTSNPPSSPEDRPTSKSVSTHLAGRGQAPTGKPKSWKFPFQKRYLEC